MKQPLDASVLLWIYDKLEERNSNMDNASTKFWYNETCRFFRRPRLFFIATPCLKPREYPHYNNKETCPISNSLFSDPLVRLFLL